MKKKFLLIALGGLFLASCGGEEKTENTPAEEVVEEKASFSYDPAETVLTWTAFKLTEKVGVSGTFDEINVVANDGAEDIFGVLNGASFIIPVESLNSQDEVRDPKVKKSFFGVMDQTAEISGMVKSLSEKSGTVEIQMNGIAHTYEGEVKVAGDQITFLTTINILDFEAQASMDSLGVVCEAKHTGPDGVNKLWNDVEIAVKTTLIRNL